MKNVPQSKQSAHRIYENVPWEPERLLSMPDRDPDAPRILIERRETLGWSFLPWKIDRILENTGSDRSIDHPFGTLAESLQSIRLSGTERPTPNEDPDFPPFQDGYVVLIPFEWGELYEPSGGPHTRPEVPFLLAECSEVVSYHHKTRTLWVPPSCPYFPDKAPANDRHSGNPFSFLSELSPSLSFEAYRERFDIIREDIRKGRFFQLNFAITFEGKPNAHLDLLALYRSLSRKNPGPGRGYFSWKDRAFLSNSPERLVTVQGGRITTSPIAGTRPAENPQPNDADAFLNDPKEQAEHVMTVDILRNDLGRICLPGTVEVSRFLAIERYAHLLHLVSDVRGQLVPSLSFWDLLTAVFPGGSVTGAPKREVRKAIGFLEDRPRGYYCGSFGFLSRSGVWDLNLLIRTLFITPKGLSLPVGSGIVGDSDARREFDEIRTKARAFLERLNTTERRS